jgi:hypothetical protein
VPAAEVPRAPGPTTARAGRWALAWGVLSLGAGVVVAIASFMTVFTTDATRSHVPVAFRPGCSAWTSCDGDVFRHRQLLSLVDYTSVTPWVVVAVIVTALTVAGVAFAHRRIPPWALHRALKFAMIAAAVLCLQFILVVQQFRDASLNEANRYLHLRLSAWGVVILVASLVPVLAAVGVRLATTPVGPLRATQVGRRASIAAGLVILACSLANVFTLDHARSGLPDRWGSDFRCRAWQTCPRDTSASLDTGEVPLPARLSVEWLDYTALTFWLLLALVVVAVAIPSRLRRGQLPSRRLARAHLTATAVTIGLLWLQQLLVVLELRRAPGPGVGDVTVSYYLRPTFWGGMILAASLVVLLSAIVISRQRDPNDRKAGGQSESDPEASSAP